MIDPKEFFRKLDRLLAKVSRDKTGKNFLASIATELEHVFGADLHLQNGRIYEENGGEYILIHVAEDSNGSTPPEELPIDSHGVSHVLKYGSYIFDDPALSIDRGVTRQVEYAVPAAFEVESDEQSWIFVFELKSGWIREEVEFTLNAVRTMLNYRLSWETVRGEMQRAALIQGSLLPEDPPQIHGFEIAGRSQPAELVGGDLFDYYKFDDEMFGVAIGDASGHGIPAALLVRDVVTGLRMGLEKELKMVHTIRKLNKVVNRSASSSGFISLFYCEVESNGSLIYVNAGHPSPILVNGEDVEELESTGLILGPMPEITLHRAMTKLQPGAVLLLFTDGIFEREDRLSEQYGLARLKRLVRDNRTSNAAELLKIVFDDVYAFGGKRKWKDDATVVVIRRLDTEELTGRLRG